MTALTLDNVSISYGDGDTRVHALNEVSLQVNPGEFVGVVGPSGSGKSTLLAVAGALTRPESGSVRLAGEEITTFSDAELVRVRRDHIGFVCQSSGNLPSALKARDQLEFAARITGRQGRRTTTELLVEVGRAHLQPGHVAMVPHPHLPHPRRPAATRSTLAANRLGGAARDRAWDRRACRAVRSGG